MKNKTVIPDAIDEKKTAVEFGVTAASLPKEDQTILLLMANAFKVRDEKEKLLRV